MRRWIISILICVTLGAITTIAVAWERAWTAPRDPGRYRGYSATDEATGTTFYRMDRPGRRFLSSEREARLLSHIQSSYIPQLLVVPYPPPAPWPEEIELQKLLPVWTTIHNPDPLSQAESRWVAAFGWPAISMCYGATCRVNAIGSVVPWTYWGAVDPESLGLPNQKGRIEFRMEKRLLPLHPVWPGFAIDTGIYGLTWFLLLSGFVGARRLIRARRGLCPRCAYDLRRQFAAGCPECGWNREPMPTCAP
jgi:hypothetical protein